MSHFSQWTTNEFQCDNSITCTIKINHRQKIHVRVYHIPVKYCRSIFSRVIIMNPNPKYWHLQFYTPMLTQDSGGDKNYSEMVLILSHQWKLTVNNCTNATWNYNQKEIYNIDHTIVSGWWGTSISEINQWDLIVGLLRHLKVVVLPLPKGHNSGDLSMRHKWDKF